MTGNYYRFKVVVFNFNGPSEASEITAVRVCGQPSGLDKPVKLAATTAPEPSITVQWRAPASSGGCPILGYVVYVDDGADGLFVEANQDNDPLVRDRPTLNELTITRAPTIGATYRIKVTARGPAGEVTSPVLGVVLA